MPSPFPGMNPYLEQAYEWHSFHKRFCPHLADEVVAKTDRRHMVKFEENLYSAEKLSSIEVRDVRSRRLVTNIELLSPINKLIGPDRDQYLAKRSTLMRQGANFVEIDLLRGGPRMPMKNTPSCDYLVMVARPSEWPRAGIWPIQLRDRLPDIPIPLAESDPDAIVSLQALLHAIYDAAGYERFIYESEPEPPLKDDDAAWARRLIPESAAR